MLDLFPYLIVAVLMGIVVYAIGLLMFPNQWALLLAQFAGGSSFYICLCRAFRLKAFMDSWNEMWSRMILAGAGTTK